MANSGKNCMNLCCSTSLALESCSYSNLRSVIFKFISNIDISSISCDIAPRWLPQVLMDDQSTLVQVMAWCHEVQTQCWPISLSPYGMTSVYHIQSTLFISWPVKTQYYRQHDDWQSRTPILIWTHKTFPLSCSLMWAMVSLLCIFWKLLIMLYNGTARQHDFTAYQSLWFLSQL